MTYKFLLITALRSFARHKMRSFLTTIGIIIGIVSIISVMSIGEGATSKVKNQINKLGTNFIVIFGGSPKRMVAMRGQGFGNLTLKPEDFEAVVEECEDIKNAAPIIVTSVTAVYESSNWKTMIAGTNEKLLSIRNITPILGTNFTKQDIKSKNKVLILGKTVAEELFAEKNPIGKIVRIQNFPFKVIGVLEEQGKTPDGRDQDDTILAPITTVHRKILGSKNQNFSIMVLNTENKDLMKQASTDVIAILRQKHKLRETEEDDFTLFTQDDVSQAADEVSKILNLLLVMIASISLIVGGIGIMNIMLVTVAERTKEIGLRMAIGATAQNIQNQFILEAITICLLGGFLGIFFGVATSIVVGKVLCWTISISIKSIFLSLLSSTAIGLFFGFYPAYKASQLNPIEALFDR